MRVTRRPVTLLELLVVIAILALAAGIVAVSINKALVDQRFRSEVGMVVDELRLAQDIMLILGKDVRVVFVVAKGGKGIDYSLEIDSLFPKHIQRELERKKARLTTVKGVFFHDDIENDSTEGRLEIKFLSNGAIMSSGLMRLSSSDREDAPPTVLDNYVCLTGYPRPIESMNTFEEAKKLCTKSDDALATQLTQDTWQRVPEKAKARDVPGQGDKVSEPNIDPKAGAKDKPDSAKEGPQKSRGGQ